MSPGKSPLCPDSYAHAPTPFAVFCYKYPFDPDDDTNMRKAHQQLSPITSSPSTSHTRCKSTTYAPCTLRTSSTPIQPILSASISTNTKTRRCRSSANSPATRYCHSASTEAYCCAQKTPPSGAPASPSGCELLAAAFRSRTRRTQGSALG